MEPGLRNDSHSHPFDVRAPTLTWDGPTRTWAEGASYVVERRASAGAA